MNRRIEPMDFDSLSLLIVVVACYVFVSEILSGK
jgi:hypothetical protein